MIDFLILRTPNRPDYYITKKSAVSDRSTGSNIFVLYPAEKYRNTVVFMYGGVFTFYKKDHIAI